MKFRPDAGAGIGNADFDGVRDVGRLTAAVSVGAGLAYAATLPHVRFGVQPDGTALGRVLGSVFQQIGNDALDFRAIEGERRQFVIGEKIQGEAALLKAAGPEAANFREAGVQVTVNVLHAQFADFEHAKGQEILNELL